MSILHPTPIQDPQQLQGWMLHWCPMGSGCPGAFPAPTPRSRVSVEGLSGCSGWELLLDLCILPQAQAPPMRPGSGPADAIALPAWIQGTGATTKVGTGSGTAPELGVGMQLGGSQHHPTVSQRPWGPRCPIPLDTAAERLLAPVLSPDRLVPPGLMRAQGRWARGCSHPPPAA